MASSLHSPSPPPYNSPSPNSGVYRSTPDSRSSVLSRAREYTRRVEDDARRRSKSLDRNNNNNNSNNNIVNLCSPSSQSQSVAYPFNHPNTRQQSPSARSTASGRSYGSSHRGREGNSRLSTNSNGTNNNNNNYYFRRDEDETAAAVAAAKPNLWTFNTVLAAWSRSRDPGAIQKAESLLRTMESLSLSSNSKTRNVQDLENNNNNGSGSPTTTATTTSSIKSSPGQSNRNERGSGSTAQFQDPFVVKELFPQS
mmetsp:Transcript_22618/g.49191  ORF Transcript_22618/g.49191 Transcript_22618/m.49191 type:complete len:254 (-) Transcript_22618:37-798(-)